MPPGDEHDLPELDLSARGRARDVLDLFDLPALPEQAVLDWAAELERRLQHSGAEPEPEEAERYDALMQQLLSAAALYPPLSRGEIQSARALCEQLQAGAELSSAARESLRQTLLRLVLESQQALADWLASQSTPLTPVTAMEREQALVLIARLQRGASISRAEQEQLARVLKAQQR